MLEESNYTNLAAILVAQQKMALTNVTLVRLNVNEAAAQANKELVATPGAGNHIEVYEAYLRCGGIGTLSILDSAAKEYSGILPVGTNDLFFRPMRSNGEPIYILDTDTALDYTTVGAGLTIDGDITYAIKAD